MYGILAAVGLVVALLFGVLFFSAESAVQETAAATAGSACLLFAVAMMLGHLAKVLEEQKEELRRQTEYLKWMQETAERMIAAYVTSRSKLTPTGTGTAQHHAAHHEPRKERDKY